MSELTIETRKAYVEILEVLKHLPSSYTEKIPPQILNVFEKEKMYGYAILLDNEHLINKDTLRKETLEIIALLNYQYWCEDEKLKSKLYEIYTANDEEEVLDVERMVSKSHATNMQLALRKEGIFQKIINRIKNFFNRLKTNKEVENIDLEG